MKQITRSGLLVLIVVFVASVGEAVACTCMVTPTIDVAFAQTPNVAIMRLVSVEKAPESEQIFPGYERMKSATLSVEKIYKGNLKVGQEMKFAQGSGADCIFIFRREEIGKDFVLYLGEKPTSAGVWVASTCSRSNRKEGAVADMLYLDNLESVRGKSRLSGRVIQLFGSPFYGSTREPEVLARGKVLVSGAGKKLELMTDSDGVFQIYGLPPGKYTVTPEPIAGYRIGYSDGASSVDVELKAAGHAEANIVFTIQNRISGKFLDKNGQPLKDVCLRLRPKDSSGHDRLFPFDCTDAAGAFAFHGIPEGSWVLLVNEEDKISSDEPFGRFYYPSAKRVEDAAVIQIGPGDIRDDLIVNAPRESAEVLTISGRVLLEDGKPATDKNTEYVSIEFFTDVPMNPPRPNGLEREPEARTQIDTNGRFTIRILKGQSGKLMADMSVYAGKYLNCPKLDRVIKASRGGMPDIKSSSVSIGATSDRVGVDLKFPFPSSCQLAPRAGR